MTESLLKQARRWREIAGTCIVPIGEPNLAEFLDAVIEFLEWAKSEPAQFETVISRPTQRKYTLAIMTAILASVSNDPNFDSIAMAELLLAKVEERQR